MFGYGRYGYYPPPRRHEGCGCGCGTFLVLVFLLLLLEMLKFLFC